MECSTMKSHTVEAIDILTEVIEELQAVRRRLQAQLLAPNRSCSTASEPTKNKEHSAMIVISSTSGRTISLQEGTCGGLGISVGDGRKDDRHILLSHEQAKQLSDALLAWLQPSRPRERIEHDLNATSLKSSTGIKR
jgi:hypothetical protein